MIQSFDRVRESMYTHTLPNGLRIYYIPKPGFSKTFAMIATKFGSIDQHFVLEDGTKVQVPAGVAHFLEHKMFEGEDGNALQKFAATGACPNAFTSQDRTAFFFSCTDRFNENLEILMNFMFKPHFTAENVQKEKGIIEQEICMMADMAPMQAMNGLYKGLYQRHPIRMQVGGTVESIAQITPDILYTCYQAFYSPSNMVLTVCGNADWQTICSIAQRYSPEKAVHIAARDYGDSQPEVCQHEIIKELPVAHAIFRIGFKDTPLQPGENAFQRKLLGDLCCRLLGGQTAPLYTELYREGMINRTFSSTYGLYPEAAHGIFGGHSLNPQAACARIEAEVQRLATQGVPPALFERMKRASYGMQLRVLDQPDAVCMMQCGAALYGQDFMAFAALYDKMTANDVQQMLKRWAQPNHTSRFIFMPQGAERKG